MCNASGIETPPSGRSPEYSLSTSIWAQPGYTCVSELCHSQLDPMWCPRLTESSRRRYCPAGVCFGILNLNWDVLVSRLLGRRETQGAYWRGWERLVHVHRGLPEIRREEILLINISDQVSSQSVNLGPLSTSIIIVDVFPFRNFGEMRHHRAVVIDSVRLVLVVRHLVLVVRSQPAALPAVSEVNSHCPRHSEAQWDD